MTTLITGGTGFLGSSLACMLMESGERPVLFDLAPPGGILSTRQGRFDYAPGSIDNLSVLLNCINQGRIDRIFHLGGMLSLPSENSPWGSFHANVVGTYNVLEAARIAGVRQIVYGSTIAVYSEDLPSVVVDDRTLQRPASMYGTTKVFGELLGRFYARRFNIDFRGVRLPSVVGPGAKTAHMSIYNAWAIEEALKGNPYEIFCEPETRCPAIYFKDAARAVLLLSEADRERVPTMIYNIAGIAPPFSARELVETVRSRIPEAQLTFNPDPAVTRLLNELGRITFDESAARKEWGWQPQFTLEAMVDDFILEFHRNLNKSTIDNRQ